MAVGRLDINTEGLLLLTNDGGLAKVIAHPDTGWLRRYRVRAHGDTDQAQLDRLAKGVTIDGMEYGPVEATLDRVQGDNVWLTLGLREGKNREVKNILGALGLDVTRLIRLSYGPFQLGELAEGEVRELKGKLLRDQLGERIATEAGADMQFDFPSLIAHAARTRPLSAGTIIGSGTVSNRDRSRGWSCIAEVRMIETIRGGAPVTPFLKKGDTVRIWMEDDRHHSIFGAIEQTVE